MPPRIRCLLPVRSRCLRASPLLRTTNLPFASTTNRTSQPQIRAASILSSISDVRSAYHKPIKRGRGPSSGKGKTSGRGHKGQKQHGKVPRGFEGGQTPLRITHGIRGFKNVFSVDMQTVPLSRIHSWVAQGRLDPSRPITIKELSKSRCVSSIKDGVKLLTDSNSQTQSIDAFVKMPQQPLHIVVSRASASAIAAVEKGGGSVTTRYYTRWAIQQIRKGKMDPIFSLQSARALETTKESDASESEPKETEASKTTTNGLATIHATFAEMDSRVPAAPVAPFANLAFPQRQYQYRLPDATSRKDIEYYRDPAHRGYLSHLVEEGKGPSLFFRTPEESKARLQALVKKGRKKVHTAENLLW